MHADSVVRTRRTVPAGEPLLVGSLELAPAGRLDAPPELVLVIFCPWCRSSHRHTWPSAPFRSDLAVHRPAKCSTSASPLRGQSVWIGLDPSRGAENRRIIRSFRQWQALHPSPVVPSQESRPVPSLP